MDWNFIMKRVLKNGVILFMALRAGVLFAEMPQWWIARGVIATNDVPNDYALVNQGQVKQIAHQAYLEFNQKLGRSSSAISNLVAGFSTTNNYLPANLGQLKNAAKPFYDELWSVGLTNAWPVGMTVGPYPWSGSSAPSQDYAIANIGQLKYLFSFDIDAVAFLDSDGDGLPDWWELLYFGSATGAAATVDTDGDGLTNLEEYLAGCHPDNPDTNGNGVPDGIDARLHPELPDQGVLLLLPSGQYRHVIECLLQMTAYGAYGD